MIVDLQSYDRAYVCATLARLERELFGSGAWSESMIREELQAPARTYVLDVAPNAVDHNAVENRCTAQSAYPRIRGYAGFWYDGDDAEIMTIGVEKAYQREGIAAAMLERLIAMAGEQGARRVLLEVRVDNVPALGLYRRFGFTRMGLRRRYYQPENVDAYTMSLDLKPRKVGFTNT